MAKIEITKTELVWPGKYDDEGRRVEPPRVRLPFQVIERVNESRATRDALTAGKQLGLSLFDVYEGKEGVTFEDGWRNKLIWGDNLLVTSSLLEKFAGKIDLIYIDPPFATGADFSFTTQVGEGGIELTKEQSVIEEKAYRDTWGDGLHTYLAMLSSRLLVLRDLLADTGSIFVHADAHIGPYIKIVLDEIFGADNFQNQIAWYYYNKLHGQSKKCLPKAFDTIFYYLKNGKSQYTYHTLTEERDKPVKKLKYRFIRGKIENLKDEHGKTITYESTERQIDNVWRIRCLQPANIQEWVDFDTQKPVDLIERILEVASNPGDLVLDSFCGSGSSLVAAERLDRRWIGCDLGRFSIHTTRKRLLGTEDCQPFEILNLGRYERQYWQGINFGGKTKNVTEQTLYEYLAFILKLYGAQPVPGLTHLHGKKSRAMVHVGTVDAPVTIDEIGAAVAECVQLKQPELHVLGWEWEMGLQSLMVQEAAQRGVKLLLLNIPREVMEQQAADKGDVQFFELAYLEVDRQQKARTLSIRLKDFVIPNTDLIPEDVRKLVKKWSDYVDYWAVDWDFRDDSFTQGWVTYRTRKDRTLALETDPHTYDQPGAYQVVVKVIDIFGNDTSQLYEVKVV